MPTRRSLTELRSASPQVVPSLLACDFGRLREEIEAVEAAGAQALHLDIMDGHFVPNLSFGVPVVQAVRRATCLVLDVHLMLSDPAPWIDVFRDAGADSITFHIEVVPEAGRLLEVIRGTGAAAGLALNPATPVSAVEPYLSRCDLVLAMSVMPGFGGQEFDSVAVAKLRQLRQSAGPDLLLSVDGGINRTTIGCCADAGANMLVAGSALFSQDDYRRGIVELTQAATSHTSPQVPPCSKSS